MDLGCYLRIIESYYKFWSLRVVESDLYFIKIIVKVVKDEIVGRIIVKVIDWYRVGY